MVMVHAYLDKFVDMPNHVHVTVIPGGEGTLSKKDYPFLKILYSQ
jgi:hypothetical protein